LRNLVIYFAILLAFGAGIFAILERGRHLESARSAAAAGTATSETPQTPAAAGHARSPLPILLLQLITIVLTARALGALFRRIGQPPVIGEIVAGILLGPSLLGAVAPDVFAFLFPPASVGLLKLFAEIGVLLFLFAVGLELDVERLRHQARTAVVVSHASIVVPYFLGVGLALFLYTEFAPPGTGFLPFALFMGIAMSITAFPVLVRILKERGLAGTHLGQIAVTAAAVDDVTAWSLLAMVVAISASSGLWAATPDLPLAPFLRLKAALVSGGLIRSDPPYERIVDAELSRK